jgi:NRPS condensation-like uncharacterized protein
VTGIPPRFQATGADTAISITRAVTNHRIGMRLTFDPGQLDPNRLAAAVRLSFDAEPILGCSFRTDERKAYWSRMPSFDEASFFSAIDSVDPDGDMDHFQAREIPDVGPQAAVALFSAKGADHVGIKVSHVVADGQAAKQYAYLLADIYSHLARDPSYMPQPNLASRPSGTDVWGHLTSEQRREARRAKSWANPTWVVASEGTSGLGLTFRTAFVEPEAFRRLKDYGKQRDATINDLMLAAVFRSCVALFDPPALKPLSLMCTAELRRYLPDPRRLPISNISISGSLDIERVDGENFDATLARVQDQMAIWAKQCYGAGPLVNAEKLAGLGYGLTKALLGLTFRMAGGSGKTYPWFTNIGVLDEARLSFAGTVPTSGHMFGPSGYGPAVVPVISTYRDRLAICMGFCAEDMDASVINNVLQSVAGELGAALG